MGTGSWIPWNCSHVSALRWSQPSRLPYSHSWRSANHNSYFRRPDLLKLSVSASNLLPLAFFFLMALWHYNNEFLVSNYDSSLTRLPLRLTQHCHACAFWKDWFCSNFSIQSEFILEDFAYLAVLGGPFLIGLLFVLTISEYDIPYMKSNHWLCSFHIISHMTCFSSVFMSVWQGTAPISSWSRRRKGPFIRIGSVRIIAAKRYKH